MAKKTSKPREWPEQLVDTLSSIAGCAVELRDESARIVGTAHCDVPTDTPDVVLHKARSVNGRRKSMTRTFDTLKAHLDSLNVLLAQLS